LPSLFSAFVSHLHTQLFGSFFLLLFPFNFLLFLGEERLGISVRDGFEAVKGDLRSKSLPKWAAIVSRLLFDPETREEAIEAGLLPDLLSVFDEESLIPSLAQSLFWSIQRFSDMDSLKTLVLAADGFKKSASLFARLSPEGQFAALTPFRNFLSRGGDIRRQTIEERGLLRALQSLASIDSSRGIQAYGIILALYSNSPEARNAVIESMGILFSAVKGKNLEKRDAALDCLMEAAAMPEVRPRLLELGAKEVVQPFVDDENSNANFVAVLIIALFSASDVDEKTKAGMNPTSSAVIKKIMGALESFAKAKLEIPTVGKYLCHCKLILLAMRSLATNEANLKELKTQNVVAVLKELLTARRQDLFLEDLTTLQQVRCLLCIYVDLNCLITNFSSLRRPCTLFGLSPLTRIVTTSSLLLVLLIFLDHFRPITRG